MPDCTASKVSLEYFSEACAIYTISGVSAGCSNLSMAAAAMTAALCGLPGIEGARLNVRPGIEGVPPGEVEAKPLPPTARMLTIPLAASGRDFGTLELAARAGLPLSPEFLSVVGQQIALALARADYQARVHGLRTALQGSRDKLATRKLLERARGLLSRLKRMDGSEAEALIRRRAAEEGRSVRETAEAIIAAHGHPSNRRLGAPLLRRTA